MNTTSKKIILYLNDGLPKGVREITIDQWSGRAVCGPRNKIDEIVKHEGLNGPCIYFLIGDPEEGEFLNIYVGESDPFNERVKDHLRKKDWWQHVVVFSGTNNSPSKTGIQYLEAYCYTELRKAAKCTLENKVVPSLPSIPREDVSGLHIFFENLILVMPILGFDIFVQENEQLEVTVDQYIYCEAKGSEAKALLLDDGKVKVLKGSTATKNNAPSFERHNYKKIKDELLTQRRIKEEDGQLYFTEDYVFDSLSASAAVILGRSAQGPKEWKYRNGRTVKDSIEK